MDCTVFHTTLSLRFSKVSAVFDGANKKLKPEYSNVICEELALQLKVGVLTVSYTNPCAKSIQTVVKCVSCKKKFKFKLFWDCTKEGKNIDVDIYTNREECSHPEIQSTRQVRGEDRSKIAKELKGMSNQTYSDEQLKKIDLKILETTGNTQTLKSTGVIKKIRSEEKSKEDLHRNDLKDLYLKATSDENLSDVFIQTFQAFPFSVQV
jgi:rRNA maturation endonuclease Nob1